MDYEPGFKTAQMLTIVVPLAQFARADRCPEKLARQDPCDRSIPQNPNFRFGNVRRGGESDD